MSQYSLESFGAYQKARQLFDLVVVDMGELRKDPRCFRLIAQQVGSADSICSNIEEGHGRLSRPEYIRFLDFARGSARETRGRYERFKHWFDPLLIEERVGLADEIIGILTRTILTLQHEPRNTSKTSYLREGPIELMSDEEFPPSPPDPRPPSP